VCVVVADVAGHGVRAALTMGELRSVLRGYALVTEEPAQILSLLNTHMRRFHPEVFTTALCAMLEPSGQRLTLSIAGHLPPIHALPGHRTVIIPVLPDLPLGVIDGGDRRTTTVDLAPGSVVAFYTDGLLERRNSTIDTGMELLCGCVDCRCAEAVCVTVMATLIGAHTPQDDVALLVLRRYDTPGSDAR
jgi:phosphoserine phosphatase RsbU/P